MFGMRRHECKWVIVDRHYSPPVQKVDLGEFQGNGALALLVLDQIRRLTEGVTHVYLRCSACGDLREKDMFGHFVVTGEL